ncbi:MAG TPA: betaine/proline/choline family ABC transporter ATP-binding protein [Trueperaceae bacterium]|nr:betaine/proline/choline family ABC transporter ATP-binding protein [Trueperaceae bacterium]
MIRAEGVTKIFGPDPESALRLLEQGRNKDEIRADTGHTVGVNNVSFALEPGEFFVIMGLSGSGKSTLLRCINRLIEPTAGKVFLQTQDEGEVEITGMDPATLRRLRKTRMSMVFQRFSLFPHRTILSNVTYGLEIQRRDRREAREIGEQMIELVGLGGYEESFPRQLSGGMQQRVGLARALATEAHVLLMDEPFSALDPLIKMQMQDELIKIERKLARTILFITHDLNEALRLGDRIAIMESGNVVQIGTPEEIIVNPRTEYVADFVEHADPTGVITAQTVALPLEHERFVLDHREGDVRFYRHKAQEDVVIGVDEDEIFRGMRVSGEEVRTVPLLEALEEPPPDARMRDRMFTCAPDVTLRKLLRGRTYVALPTMVLDEGGRVRGVVTERELVEGILEKRGNQDLGSLEAPEQAANGGQGAVAEVR